MLTGGPTFRASSQAQQSQAGGDVSQAVRDAIANDPTLVIRTVENFMTVANPVDTQVLFVDSELTPNDNGIYGFKDDRDWKRIGDIQR